jgi:hypothetical protein
MISCGSGFDLGKVSVPASVPVPNPNLEPDQDHISQKVGLSFLIFFNFFDFVFHFMLGPDGSKSGSGIGTGMHSDSSKKFPCETKHFES